MKVLSIIALSLFCLFSAVSYADADSGAAIANVGDGSGAPCAACHGMQGEGNQMAGFPRLAGLSQGYLVKQLNDYIEGRRISQIMAPNVNDLTSEQVEEVATYYANLPVTKSEALTVDPSGIGKILVESGDWHNYLPPCASCHGVDSAGVGAVFPALAGQHATYIMQQLQDWKTGTRNNDPLGLMSNIAKRLSDEQIQAVAHYLTSLEPKATKAKSSIND
ncbi:cytochrome c [Aliiglaciecola sp. 3_MG-2023]|uniref:c-type cytochrome n=1 Tax=Aliiglaciecola sp. 3_MG-2023 TaxID=3062644 RepID=UPI0026E1A00F|nr:cytochrome c [Aliiglaciecola sp. 3_MG-2023]MDO6695085.1 cytochrome c [Aliiglaciecola sp. 3_MG-2023]